MPDKPATQAPVQRDAEPMVQRDPELLPMDRAEGSGQRMDDQQRAVFDSQAELEAARTKADEDYRRAQASIRARQRELAESALQKQRDEAMAAVGDQSAQMMQMPNGVMMPHPAYLEMEGARNRAVADALQLDETVPGGRYIVDGRLVDANGERLD